MKQQQLNNENHDDNLFQQLMTTKSPGGYSEDNIGNKPKQKGCHKWPLQIQAPDILGQTFESILGAIFLGSNSDDVFLPLQSFKPKIWNLRYCVLYLIKFLCHQNNGDNEMKQFKWDKWIGKQPQINHFRQKQSIIKRDTV